MSVIFTDFPMKDPPYFERTVTGRLCRKPRRRHQACVKIILVLLCSFPYEPLFAMFGMTLLEMPYFQLTSSLAWSFCSNFCQASQEGMRSQPSTARTKLSWLSGSILLFK